MCVLGGTAVHGAGQQLRMRGAYVETAVATPLPHMTQLPTKTTHWAFPCCPPSFAFHDSPSRLSTRLTTCLITRLITYILLIQFFFHYHKKPSVIQRGLDAFVAQHKYNSQREACLSVLKKYIYIYNQANIKTQTAKHLFGKKRIM